MGLGDAQFLLKVLAALAVATGLVVAPPPKRPVAAEPPPLPDADPDDPTFNLTYNKYLMEVVKVLESDSEFQAKMANYSEKDIKDGVLTKHLDELPVDIRTKLTEAKRKEVERLREAIQEQVRLGSNDIKMPEHVELSNLDTFERADLHKLIQSTVTHLEELDVQRRADFKEYEMKKEAERKHRVKQMPEAERAAAESEHERQRQEHDKHPNVHHPGSKDQLEEVWEEKDDMPAETFDPRTFFALHDMDGNGYWDEGEIEALFQIELDKVYNDTDPDDDPRERIEEMNRMREHVFEQMDKNKDGLISLAEFIEDTATDDYQKDQGWDTLDDEKEYTAEELRRFEEEYAKQQGWNLGDDWDQPLHVEAPQPPPVDRRPPDLPPVPVHHEPSPPIDDAEKRQLDQTYGV